MANEVLQTNDGKSADLTDFLTSKDAVTRVIGRGIVAGWTRAAADWMQAELDRGIDPDLLLHALSHLQVEVTAALVAGGFKQTGDAAILEALKRHLDRKLPMSVAHVRNLHARTKADPINLQGSGPAAIEPREASDEL